MCGIAGFLSFNEPFHPADEMGFHTPLRFRGPDHFGKTAINTESIKGKLFHYRLSILDLDARSNQPMKSNSGKSEIVFNGEIYNYRELKQQLEKLGFSFKTNSDTEVILAAYEHFGIDQLVKKIDGMFSFVLVDHISKTIHLARDPFGKKPLYYYWNKAHGQLAFSSDIRSFEQLGISLTLDHDALSYYFCELSTPELLSIYKEVKKIPPGNYFSFSSTNVKTENYFRLNYSKKLNISRTEILEESERLLENAVKKRLISDVGVSAFLSGGIDSSLVVAMMAKNSSKPINTYTVGFSNKTFDESGYAKKVAEKWGTNHHEILMDEMSLAELKFVFEECGEPFADASVLPTYMICSAISKTEKVALSGDGGDEIFGGYYEYYFASRLDKYASKKSLIRLLANFKKIGINTTKTRFAEELMIHGFNIPPAELLHRKNMGFHPDEVKKLLHSNSDFPRQEFNRIWNDNKGNAQSYLDRVMSGSLHTRLVNDYLVKVDRASMMNGLEVRSPYLDRDLVEFMVQIPNDQLIFKGIPKSIPKEIAKKYLPGEDIHRKKMGFGVPIGEWFKSQLKSDLIEAVEAKSELIDPSYSKNIATAHFNGNDQTDKLVTLFAFHLWSKSRVQ